MPLTLPLTLRPNPQPRLAAMTSGTPTRRSGSLRADLPREIQISRARSRPRPYAFSVLRDLPERRTCPVTCSPKLAPPRGRPRRPRLTVHRMAAAWPAGTPCEFGYDGKWCRAVSRGLNRRRGRRPLRRVGRAGATGKGPGGTGRCHSRRRAHHFDEQTASSLSSGRLLAGRPEMLPKREELRGRFSGVK